MKPLFFRLYLLSFSLIPLCAARAALDPAIVADDAHWVAYADFDALRGSVLGKELIGQIQKEQKAMTGGEIGINFDKVFATVRTATAYGVNISSDSKKMDGVLVVQGSPDLRKIVEGLLVEETLDHPGRFSEIAGLPFPAYAISAGGGKEKEKGREPTELVGRVVIGFPPEPIVLVSRSVPQLLKAREVFRGASPSLGHGASSPLDSLIGSAKDAYLFAAVIAPPLPQLDRRSVGTRLFLLAESGSVAIGETGENAFAHIELQAKSDETAEKMTKILQGMAAMASLAESNDKQLTEFLNSAAVTSHEHTVGLSLSYSSARLAQMIQGLRQEHVAGGRAREAYFGRVVGEWNVDQKAEPAAIGGLEPMVWETIPHVHLENGANLTVTGFRNGGPPVVFARLEISPTDAPGHPLVFHAGYLRLMGFRFRMDRQQPRAARLAESVGETSYAQVIFPAWDGDYTVRIAYAPQPGGKGRFSLSVKDPEAPVAPDQPPAAPAAPANDDARERSAH